MRVSLKILEGCLFGVLGGVVFWVCLFVVVVCFIYCLFVWGYFFLHMEKFHIYKLGTFYP